MPWYMQWSDSIKKRACRYLLQRYLGQFLEEKLTLNQLTVDLYNGTGSVSGVVLDVQALNELGEQENLPIEFVDGYISEMSVSIPWSQLFTESSYIEVSGLILTVQPKKRADDGGSMFESMWNSMTNSMQLAAECLQQSSDDKEQENVHLMEGLEIFANAIESVLTRIKIKFLNTTLRVEHLPKQGNNGIAVELRIHTIDYCDEACSETPVGEEGLQATYHTSTFSIKKFHCEGVTLSTDEFPAANRTFSRSIILKQSCEKVIGNVKPVTDLILFGKLSGRQEVRLKLKQDESVLAPKVDIELNLGSLTLFLSPRQLHLLIELMHGLGAPHTQDNSNVEPRNPFTQKPMHSDDYEKVEQELQDTLTCPSDRFTFPKGLNNQGWSSAQMDESQEEFFPMKSAHCVSESILSDVSSDTSVTSTYTSATFNSKGSGTSCDSCTAWTNYKRKGSKGKSFSGVAESVFHGEMTAFHFRLTSFALVILHEDVLTFGLESSCLTAPSISNMKNLSEKFFQSLGLVAFHGYGNKDFEKVKNLFSTACLQSHIRFISTAVKIEGTESGNQANRSFNVTLTAASLEAIECIYNEHSSVNSEPQYVELLRFMKANTGNMKPHFPISSQPDLRIYLKQQKKFRHSNQTTSIKTDISVNIQQCWSEIDVSIIDRINSIIHPEPLCHTVGSSKECLNEQSSFSKAVENASTPDVKCDFELSSPFIILKFRFPIPDLRPLHDIERSPWWRRSVRKDILFFHLIEPTIHTESNNRTFLQSYKIYCSEILALFQEGSTNTPIVFARATGDDKSENKPTKIGQCLGLPCVSFKVCPKEIIGELEETVEESSVLSQSCFIETPQKQPSPFTSKHVVHGTSYSSGGQEHSHANETDGEELILPAKKQEMTDFINFATRGSRFQVDVTLPFIAVHFPSKHFYEVIYNRINSDLSLWQSTAPKMTSDCPGNIEVNDYLKHPLYPAFSLCKSGLQYDSDSDTEESNSRIYFSPYEQKNKSVANLHGQSKLALNITINQGMLNIFTNLRDSSGNIVPEQHGELQINLEDANAFVVTYYKGIPQQNYICLLVNDAALYHKAVTGKKDMNGSSPIYSAFETPVHLEQTIYYKSNSIPGKQKNSLSTDSCKDILSAAVHTEVNENRVKTIRISCGLRSATLRHKVCLSQHAWLTQLMDFFDVVDYPVRGYDSPQVITELHQHIWDCTIDYRPIHLPLKCALTLGSLSVSSNIAARTKSSTLRFIAEDANLFISDKVTQSSSMIDLRKDYVSVIELGLFELTLRLADQHNNPKVDLKASNNVLNIRTCSDSARALAQLIKYFASDGDLTKNNSSCLNKTTSSSSPILVQMNQDVEDHSLSESTVQRVNTMMEDAMQDVYGNDGNKIVKTKHQMDDGDVEVFIFPDEGTPNEVPTPVDWGGSDMDSENDFCMLEHEAGSGMMPKSGMPEIRVLTQNSIHVVDNHFSLAMGKADLLLPPKQYPNPVYRYTLQDMTLIWHMYGGNDFTSVKKPKKQIKINDSKTDSKDRREDRKENVNTEIDDLIPESTVSCSKESATFESNKFQNRRTSSQKKVDPASFEWHIKGGAHRDHNILMQLQLNKVKFQHEVYPEKGVQASRQVLLVHELEIRDRLSTSHINKFLYQYTSEASPRQSHANMVVIKAVHLRPDPRRNVQETCLKLSLLPLRLNIDQDSLLFLINFFSQLSGVHNQVTDDSALPSTAQHQIPVMSVEKDNVENSVRQPPLLIMLDDETNNVTNNVNVQHFCESSGISPMYVRSFVFSPEVPIRIDYEGKRVDMTHGPLAGLLMGLGQLSCLQLKLKKISYRHGLLGFDKLASFIISEWIQDIKKNQLPNLIGGVGPMHSLVQLFQGIRDLFWLPIEQYQKDGRIVRGLQRGANSFTTSTAIAALEITARIVQAIQSVAETAFDILSPGPSSRKLHGKKGKRQHRYSQPADIREGVANAYNLVKEGLGETAETLVRVANAEAEQKGAVGAVGGVLRQIPPTVVAPIILASAATSNLLGGVKSQLAPDARREASFKWRSDDI